jgi:hypothetical protein
MITLAGIEKKLGFNPLTYNYCSDDPWLVDDRPSHVLDSLSVEELDFLIDLAFKTPECWED